MSGIQPCYVTVYQPPRQGEETIHRSQGKTGFAEAGCFLSVIALLALALVLAGCGGPAVFQGTTATVPGSQSATATLQADSGGYQEVTFESTDGVKLSGRLYGTGTRYVILSHMYPTDQTSWHQVAQRLAEQGYAVLTYDFRGYGRSEGTKDTENITLDLEGAVKHAATVGATDIMFVGASMGGTASLIAAYQFQTLSSIRVAGVVALSAPVEFQGLSVQVDVASIEVPMLLVAAQGDAGAAEARRLQELSGGRGQLEILLGNEHGTELFTGPQAEEIWRLLLEFVQDNMTN